MGCQKKLCFFTYIHDGLKGTDVNICHSAEEKFRIFSLVSLLAMAIQGMSNLSFFASGQIIHLWHEGPMIRVQYQ